MSDSAVVQPNETVLAIVREVIEQHQAIIAMNARLVALLGYPVIVVGDSGAGT